ncbi:MAG TPA: penicillin-binding transpeptidase domain-containing protein [Polyangiaceae bacterium]|jgi:beta-lactamase regulating signal transducer with metallopeptidase domain
MLSDSLIGYALRSAFVLAAALLAMPLLRRGASATRRLVLAVALASALALPALSAALPAWRVEAPALVAPVRGKLVAEAVTIGEALAFTPAPASSSAAAASPRVSLLQVAGSVWAFGALLLLARLTANLVRARDAVRRAGPAPAWERARLRAERVTGVRLLVRETPELDAPAVFGVFTPLVLVPPSASHWDEQRRYHVLLHEMAHVRRADCVVQIVSDLAVALHWFDPLAWLCARQLRVEREHAADDAALDYGARPSSYAEDLLAVAGALPAPAGALGMGEPARLSARIGAVLATGRNRAPLGSAKTTAVVTAASSAVLALACATPAAVSGAHTSSSGPIAAGAAGSSIDPAIQAIADEELERTVREWAAPAGAAVVLDPQTGRVLADAGWDHGARSDVARLHAYVTGSTMKPVTLAAALDANVVSPTDTIDCEQGKFHYGTVEDWSSFGVLPLAQAVAVSSNVAFVKVFDRLGAERLLHQFRVFHFGTSPGWAPDHLEDHSLPGALAAMGEAVTATPLQVAAAYVAIASGGSYVEPTFSANAPNPAREQVMKPETAKALVGMLDQVVNSERGTGDKARVEGARVAGKTGTAAWDLPGDREGRYASFVGFVPEEAPRLVILVGIEQPKNDAGGGEVAAPAFSRIATRALAIKR